MSTLKKVIPGVAAAGALLVGIVVVGPTAPTPSAAVTAPATPVVAGAPRPNIMVVMLDDMRSDELRFAPNARRFIQARGLDFRNSFSPYPLCCPARASFLLGKYAHNHRVLYHNKPYGFGSLDDSVTLATRLRQSGYNTAMVGKYLNKYGVHRSKVTGRSSIRYVPNGWTDWKAGLDTRWPAGSPNAGNTYDYFRFTQNINGRVVPHPGVYSSTVIGNQVRGLISKYHRADKPFFLWVTPVAPHSGGPTEADDPGPVQDRRGKWTTYGTPGRPHWVRGRFDHVLPSALGQPLDRPAERDVSDKPWNIRKWPETTARERRVIRDVERQRAESIYAWDVEFGKIVSRLKRTGEFENTVLMFTSDNGFFNGEHRQRGGKIKAYEPVLHVPLLVAGPGVRRGIRYTPITTLDLTPTILELARARPLPAMDGNSKVGALRGPDPGWETAVVTEGLLTDLDRRAGSGVPRGFTTSGLRVGRYKLIRYSTGEAELYDLLTDPLELHSRWRDPAYLDVRRRLVQLWTQYRSCRGNACRVPLPEDLRLTPEQLAAQDRVAVKADRLYYG